MTGVSGCFDNPATMCREWWYQGKCVETLTAMAILVKKEYGGLDGLVPKWKHFPPPPKAEL